MVRNVLMILTASAALLAPVPVLAEGKVQTARQAAMQVPNPVPSAPVVSTRNKDVYPENGVGKRSITMGVLLGILVLGLASAK